MADPVALTKFIKRIAIDAVRAAKPAEVCFGKVISTTPLKISVEQKMTLGSAQLILSRNVTDHKVFITGGNIRNFFYTGMSPTGTPPDYDTAPVSPPHVHAVGKIKIIIHNGLVVGDEVILLRQQGGQKYIVVDRIG